MPALCPPRIQDGPVTGPNKVCLSVSGQNIDAYEYILWDISVTPMEIKDRVYLDINGNAVEGTLIECADDDFETFCDADNVLFVAIINPAKQTLDYFRPQPDGSLTPFTPVDPIGPCSGVGIEETSDCFIAVADLAGVSVDDRLTRIRFWHSNVNPPELFSSVWFNETTSTILTTAPSADDVRDCFANDHELAVLCDDNGSFLRRYSVDSDGVVNTVDTTLDGVTSYTPVGSVISCFMDDHEVAVLCDDNGSFLRRYVVDDNGAISTVDTTLDGITSYTPVGPEHQCNRNRYHYERLCESGTGKLLFVDGGGEFAEYDFVSGTTEAINIPVPSASSAADYVNGVFFAATNVPNRVLTIDVNSKVTLNDQPLFSNDGSPTSFSYGSYYNGVFYTMAGPNLYTINPVSGEVSFLAGPYTPVGSYPGTALAINPLDGRTLVTGTNGRILEIDLTGASLTGTLVFTPTAGAVTGATFDNQNNLYLSDAGTGNIYKYSQDDNFATEEIIANWPPGANSLSFYVVNGESCFIRRYDVNESTGEFSNPTSFDLDGNKIENFGEVSCCDTGTGDTQDRELICYTTDGGITIQQAWVRHDDGLVGSTGTNVDTASGISYFTATVPVVPLDITQAGFEFVLCNGSSAPSTTFARPSTTFAREYSGTATAVIPASTPVRSITLTVTSGQVNVTTAAGGTVSFRNRSTTTWADHVNGVDLTGLTFAGNGNGSEYILYGEQIV